jgi:hypothetical protein
MTAVDEFRETITHSGLFPPAVNPITIWASEDLPIGVELHL